MKYLLSQLLCFASLAADLPTLFPPALKKDDLIAIVFPASFLDNREKSQQIIDQKTTWLEQQGYRTICYPTTVNPIGYLAGTDIERAESLMNAWKNDDVKAIWCFRGGYGTCRILDLLDYEWIRTHPKILLGMSDITALHYAIQQKTGLVTFLAPVLNYFDQNDPDFDDKYSFYELEKVVVHGMKDRIELPESGNEIEVICPGRGKGKFVGGNLSLIASLCGTQWQLDTKGKILILEDVDEEIYRIDRMLWQIREAGLLESPAGVILGTWVNCKTSMLNSLTLKEVFEHYFKDVSYPVILGFPTGHSSLQTTIPLNVLAEIDTYKQSIRLLEPAVQK